MQVWSGKRLGEELGRLHREHDGHEDVSFLINDDDVMGTTVVVHARRATRTQHWADGTGLGPPPQCRPLLPSTIPELKLHIKAHEVHCLSTYTAGLREL